MFMATVRPKMWKYGRAPRTVSPGVARGNQAATWTALATRLRCVSMAALGTPVVPPVGCSSATSW